MESGPETDRLRAALTESRAEAARLAALLRTAERRVAVSQALVAARDTAGEGDAVLGAALEDLWSLTAELEDANVALGQEVFERRAELEAIDAALRESEERVRQAHRYAGAGAWEWDVPAGLVRCSVEYRDLVGLGPEAEVPRGGWADIILDEDRPALEAAARRALDSGLSEFDVEYRIRHPAKGTLWLSSRGRVDRDPEGRALRVTGLSIDVTARKSAELALRDANENLRREVEREVAAREAVQARVVQTLKLEALGQLTGGIAHDFNNLLAVVTAGTALLSRTDDPARRTRLTESIAQAAQRGADLTRRLLTFARRQALRPEPVPLGPWLAEIGALLSRSLRADILVGIEVAEDAWPVLADPSEMELAITNLALNARDAMPRGGTIRIAVRNAVLTDPEEMDGLVGEFLRLEVSDSGEGMAPELLTRAFEPFLTTKPGSGTGLGLAQVHGFAHQSGGTARIRSRLGHGTCVVLHLPRAVEARPAAPSPRGSGAAGRPLRVLAVEDDDAVASLVLDMLRHLGHVAVRAPNPAGALEMLDGGLEVDLVFTDVLMPGGMDGLDLARALRERRPELPVLLTSGYGGAPARVAAAGLPLLRKPYDLAALGEALARTAAG